MKGQLAAIQGRYRKPAAAAPEFAPDVDPPSSILDSIGRCGDDLDALARTIQETLTIGLPTFGARAGAVIIEEPGRGTLVMGHVGFAPGSLSTLRAFATPPRERPADGDCQVLSLFDMDPAIQEVVTSSGGRALLTCGFGDPERSGLLVLIYTDVAMAGRLRGGAHGLARALGLGLALYAARASRRLAERRMTELSALMTDGIIVADSGNQNLWMSEPARRILTEWSDGGDAEQAARGVVAAAAGSAVARFKKRDAGGQERAIEAVARRVTDAEAPAGLVCLVRDPSVGRQMEDLARLASRDPLTDLVNRRRFDEEMRARLVESGRYKTNGAIVLLDLDHFKEVNDTWGHAAGDSVLRAVADVLRRATRQSDMAARLGGDEFAVLLPHADVAAAAVCARKILAELAGVRIDMEGTLYTPAASVGCAAFPAHGASPHELLRAADIALYEAKRTGRNRAVIAIDPATVGAPEARAST